jgi:hypothetical protein
LVGFVAFAPGALAQTTEPPAVGEPLVWEVVGQPVDDWDRWPDANDVFVTDTAVYANGGEGLFVLRPGHSDFVGEPWTLLDRYIHSSGVYATSTGVLFAIRDALVRSTDGGHTWEGSLEDSRDVVELPSGRLVASEDACCGIAYSDDEGVSWTLVDLGDVITSAYAPWGVAYAPSSSRRPEGLLVTVGRDGAAYSTDEGVTWAPSNLVAPFAYYGYYAVYSSYDDSLYAMINGDPGEGAPDGYPTTGLVWASADGPLGAGQHTLTLDASALPAGAYLVCVMGRGFAVTRSLTLAR